MFKKEKPLRTFAPKPVITPRLFALSPFFIFTLAQQHGYSPSDIGEYLLPIERGRNCYYEFDFHCDLDNPDDVQRVRNLWLEANEVCANMGGLPSNPYGPRADIIYRRMDPTYVDVLKKWKVALDPNNILNPGQLCF